MAYNRELSQFSSLLQIDDSSKVIGIATNMSISGIVTARFYYGSGQYLTGIIAQAIPAGSTGQVQYNNGVSLGATSSFVVNQTNFNVGIGTTNAISKLTVFGGDIFVSSGVVTASNFYGNLTGTATTATSAYGILGSPNVNLGVVTATSIFGNISGTNLFYSGISTFSSLSGPVLIGAATSTGSADQYLQVGGNAYVSGNLGIGTTNATSKLQVVGDFSVTNRVLIGSATSTGTTSQNLQVTGGGYVSDNLGVGVTNPQRKLHLRATGTDGIFLDNSNQTGNSAGPILRVRGQRVDSNTSQSFSGQLVLEKWKMDGSINSGQNLGAIIFGGNFDTLPGITTGITYGASIGAIAEGAFSNINTAPTAIVFNTGTVGLGTLTLPNLTYGTEAARITSNRNLLIGATTETGTASQPLQVTGGGYISGNAGIGSTNPGSRLAVIGDAFVSGVVTATTFSGTATTATNATNAYAILGSPNLNVGVVTATSANINGDLTALTTRSQSVGEKTARVDGNTATLVFNTGGGNIAICTNPSGSVTLNVNGIPTVSSFDNTSISFTVVIANSGVARSCTAVNLNGVARTIRWKGGTITTAQTVGFTTSLGYDFYNFVGFNTVGSAATTANYEIFGSVNGNFR